MKEKSTENMTSGRRFLPALALSCALALSGCVYKVDIRQGNHLDPEAIAQVEPGMTRSQVRFIMGTPMIKDPFHTNRWDYVYYFKRGGSDETERKRAVVYFENDLVVSVDTNVPVE